MPVIALVLSTLVMWLLFWYVRMGGLDHVREMLTRRKEEARQVKIREVERTAPLRAVDDPRDAAMILMLLVARIGGDPTREHIAAVERKARSAFGFERELTERITQARFIAVRADSFEQAAVMFTELFLKRLTFDEKQQLIAMVKEVAHVEGPSEAQTDAIEVLKRRIGLAPVH